MAWTETELKDVWTFEPRLFSDSRGFFFESFRQDAFNTINGKEVIFVQDNESYSSKGVVRGLHFQAPPSAQGKLVRVVQGSVMDVAVDIRKDSPNYGKHVAVLLSAENKKQLWIPEGFAHGFIALEDDTIFQYKCTNYYDPTTEGCLVYDDPTLNIQWPEMNHLVSEKDKIGLTWSAFNSPF